MNPLNSITIQRCSYAVSRTSSNYFKMEYWADDELSLTMIGITYFEDQLNSGRRETQQIGNMDGYFVLC